MSFTLLLFNEADVHLPPCPLSPSSTCCWILMSVTRVLTILRCDLVRGEDEGGGGPVNFLLLPIVGGKVNIFAVKLVGEKPCRL